MVAAAARAAGRELFIVGFEGQTPPEWVEAYPHAWVRLGAVTRTIELLHRAGCNEVCLIGRVGRPSLGAFVRDRRALGILRRLGSLDAGDDRLLRAVVAELEGEGFTVVGADTLADDLLAPEGCIGGQEPDDVARADVRRGIAVLRALGTVDVGQAVVVQSQLVLGVEAVEGTDALLERCARLKRDGPGGVLVKGRKPGQERRVDLPTIGPRTVEAAAAAGLRGIAIEARHTLIAEIGEVERLALRLGVFVQGVEDWS